jgi:hypothetical protein
MNRFAFPAAFRTPHVYLSLLLLSSTAIGGVGAATTPLPGHALAFATWDQLFMGIGRYDPKKGWSSYEGFAHPTQPGDVFTLYTLDGEIARVTNTDPHRTSTWRTPLEWSAHISTWNAGSGEPFALAVPGPSPLAVDPALRLQPDNAEVVGLVADYLKKRKLNVPAPYLTQAYEVKLSPDGPRAFLVCAHSDASALRDNEAAEVYALALLFVETATGWKSFSLAQQTSHKPASRSIDDHQRLNALRDFYRVLACLDIDGDSRKEIVLYTAKEGFASQIDVFTFDGSRLKNVISTFKHLYN